MLVYLVLERVILRFFFAKAESFHIDMSYTHTPGIYHRKIGDILVTAISDGFIDAPYGCLLYTSPSPRDRYISRMPSSA